jgi:hypothetical protein
MKLNTLLTYIILTTPVFAVNYGEPGHNPGSEGNPGIGGPPVSNENNGNNGTNNTTNNSISSNNRVTSKNTNIGINKNTNTAYGGNSNSKSISKSNSKSIATGGNSYATGGNAKSSAYSGGNTQSVSVIENGDTHYSGSYDVRTVGNAPDIVSYSTAPCRVAIGASGGWLGGAFGFTGSVLDEGCDVWRDVVNLTAHNYKEAADMRLCDKKELSKVLAHCTTKENTEENVTSFKVH